MLDKEQNVSAACSPMRLSSHLTRFRTSTGWHYSLYMPQPKILLSDGHEYTPFRSRRGATRAIRPVHVPLPPSRGQKPTSLPLRKQSGQMEEDIGDHWYRASLVPS